MAADDRHGLGCWLVCITARALSFRPDEPAPGSQLAGGFAVAGLCDWPAYVLAPVFAAHFMATRPRHDWRWAAAFVLFAAALFAAVYAYLTLATGTRGRGWPTCSRAEALWSAAAATPGSSGWRMPFA